MIVGWDKSQIYLVFVKRMMGCLKELNQKIVCQICQIDLG